MTKLRLGVVGSGRGSNFIAIQENILKGNLDAEIVLVLSDKPSAMLERAKGYRLKALHVDPKAFGSKVDFDLELVRLLKQNNVELVILAGYMRILSDAFIEAFAGKLLNIHPSLLPLFKGLHPQRQALQAGVKESGCTVHLVTEELDSGPILLQERVPILPGDTEESLATRILAKEHRIYTQAISKWMSRNHPSA